MVVEVFHVLQLFFSFCVTLLNGPQHIRFHLGPQIQEFEMYDILEKYVQSLKQKVIMSMCLFKPQVEIQKLAPKNTKKIHWHIIRLKTPFNTKFGTKRNFMLSFLFAFDMNLNYQLFQCIASSLLFNVVSFFNFYFSPPTFKSYEFHPRY